MATDNGLPSLDRLPPALALHVANYLAPRSLALLTQLAELKDDKPDLYKQELVLKKVPSEGVILKALLHAAENARNGYRPNALDTKTILRLLSSLPSLEGVEADPDDQRFQRALLERRKRIGHKDEKQQTRRAQSATSNRTHAVATLTRNFELRALAARVDQKTRHTEEIIRRQELNRANAANFVAQDLDQWRRSTVDKRSS